ncbi:TonB-dependent receptor domain-containing protein [Ferruginibacter sp. SUN106]|uniref:TonB-dependent receptor n=1 Tax=Ferruginibacter sp. SUN106 TaxID=2978348 RepID=UPI003D35E9A2
MRTNNKLIFKSFLSILFAAIVNMASAQTIRGKVTDAVTGEPLVGATVSLEDTKFSAIVNLDGTYVLKNIPAGKYEIKVKYSGYEKAKQKDVEVKAGQDTKGINFQLKTELKELSGVVVKSTKNVESDKAARSLEKNADVVVNNLSQKAIELSPDVTVANSLQRISGISIERSSSGEGRYAIIRGMDQRYNSTLVNGIKIPSPDDKFRYVPMDLFPSDLLERLEVIKSLTPSMEADAVGGTMNLVMKNAPDKFKLNIYAAGGFNTLFNQRDFKTFDHSVINKKDPATLNGPDYFATSNDFARANLDLKKLANPINGQLGFTIGNRFLNKKLGVVLGGSYQNMYRGSDNIFNRQNPQSQTFVQNGTRYDNVATFNDGFTREYSTQQRRLGFNNKWDYTINENNKISLYNLYIHMDEFQSRYSVDSSLTTQRTGPGSGNVAVYNRSRWQIQSIYNSTLQGEHNLSGKLKFNWSAVYSLAKQNVPDQAEYEVDNEVKNGIVQNPPGYSVAGMTRIWRNNSDKDLSGYANFIYTPTLAKTKVELSAGGLYRHKERDNYYNEYELSSKGSGVQTFTDIYSAAYDFSKAEKAKGNPINPNCYNSSENIAAGYVQAKLMATKKLQVLGGVRVENTDQHYTTAIPPGSIDDIYGHIWYTDVLPSLHFKYLINNKQNLRASYFKSISRPGFFEITPYQVHGEYYDEKGNPDLNHTQADNFDLRYEYFPEGADQVLAGVFYKKIKDPIELGLPDRVNPHAAVTLMPYNFGNATNYGFEFVLTKFIGKFGVNANYTYTKSKITTNKLYRYYNNNSGQDTTSKLSQTRPMQGQSDNVGNISLLYKNGKIGLDIQLAFVYTGERLTQVSPYYGLDVWQQPYNQLDFSFEQKIIKHFTFYGKINNLTSSKTKSIIKQAYLYDGTPSQLAGQDDFKHIFVQSDFYKISYLFGLKYKF